MYSGYDDKNGDKLFLGDRVILSQYGKNIELTVCFGRAVRTVVNDKIKKVEAYNIVINAFYFDWKGHKLFPVMQKDGTDDTKYMEKVKDV